MTKTTPTIETALDRLCPMHVIVTGSGHISHVGPTLRKLRPLLSWEGARFLEVFGINRPSAVAHVRDLLDCSGIKLQVQFRDNPRTELKGVATSGPEEGTVILNLSFGIWVVDGVTDYNLTDADFAPTDLTTEMLYLVEAKSTAMDAWKATTLSLQEAKLQAEEQAFTDTLTGLKNRRAMDEILEREIARDAQFSLMQIDLDFFKSVNDTLGHGAGDHVLQVVSGIMLDEVRSGDAVARVGGDEFVIFLPGVPDRNALKRVGRRIIQRLEVPIPFEGNTCRISGSIGTTNFEAGMETTVKALMDDVDVALYTSKREGRGRQTFYDPKMRGTDRRGESASTDV